MATTDLSAEMERNYAYCHQRTENPCDECHLVYYCDGTCKQADSTLHLPACKSSLVTGAWQPGWEIEGRLASFVTQEVVGRQYLWGNMPAIDILKLKDNEGEDYSKDLNLLFAASGDPRNLIKTIAELPENYNNKMSILINDRNEEVVYRNALILMIALLSESEELAVDRILHFWYSAFLTKDHVNFLKGEVRDVIAFYSDLTDQHSDKKLPAALHDHTWTKNKVNMVLYLAKEQWKSLLTYCDDLVLSFDEARQIRQVGSLYEFAPESRADVTDLRILKHSELHRVCWQQFIDDGILLPFGYSRDEFSLPNPTLFRSGDWHLRRQEDPFGGWSFADVLKVHAGAATNDIYGKLYCYVKVLLSQFYRRLMKLDCVIAMSNLDAVDLQNMTSQATRDTGFARIETSNIADDGYLGIRSVLKNLTCLLQCPEGNKHARLLTLFMRAVDQGRDALKVVDHRTRNELHAGTLAPATRCLKSRPVVPVNSITSSARLLFQECDKLFNTFMRTANFAFLQDSHGVEVGDQHTIVEKWPTRLAKRSDEDGADEEFWTLFASVHHGTERYVEWKRTK